MENRLNWLIIGAGAIGTYLGSNLILHGHKVVFIERPEAATAIIAQGLRMNVSGQEHRILHPLVVTTISEALSISQSDAILFSVKSYDTQPTVEMMRFYANQLPPVIGLQNGVDNEPALAAVLGEGRVIPGTVTSSIYRRGPGDIVVERQRGIGIAAGYPLSSRVVQALNSAGLNAWLLAPALAIKWSKMLTNLLCNASSAILEMTPAEILIHPQLYHVEIQQLREAIMVMHALHIPIIDLPNTPVRAFTWLVENLPPTVSRPILSRFAGGGRGKKMPSLHIDLQAGKSISEVEYLNGAVIRHGAQVGITTPVNAWLTHTLLSIVDHRLPINHYAHQPDKLLLDLHASMKAIQGSRS